MSRRIGFGIGLCDVLDRTVLSSFGWTQAQPTYLSYTRSGTWYTVSNAAQSTIVGYGADVWSPEMKADSSLYLPVHVGYTNLITAARDLTLWLGHDSRIGVTKVAGPDGSILAQRFTQPDATAGLGFQPASTAGIMYCITHWIKSFSTTKPYMLYVGGANTAAFGFAIGTATQTWQRKLVRSTFSDNTETYGLNDTRHFGGAITGTDSDGVAAAWTEIGATDNYHDFAMWIPSRFIRPHTDDTVGSSILSRPGYSIVSPSGFYDVTISTGVIEHLWNAVDPATDQYLFYIDANNHLRFRVSDRKFVLTIGGSVRASSSAKAYSGPHNVGPVRVWSRRDGCGFVCDGDTVTGSAQSGISVPATVYLLSNNGASVFSSHVRLAAGDACIALRCN